MSDPTSSDTAESPTLAKNCTVDAVVAVVLLVFGAVVAFESWRLGARWTSDGPGAGYFPFYIGVIICIAALGILYQATLGKAKDEGGFVDHQQLKQVMQVLVPAVLYVFVCVFLGLYVASALYIALFMIVLGKYKVVKSVLVAVIVNAVFFAMFEVWFKVPLFKGSLEPLRFLGY